VHLTAAGYLTTAGWAVPVGEARTVLAGWNPDETYWLADVLTHAGPAAHWERQEEMLTWALAGNPAVLLVLFVPDEEVVFRNQVGAELAGNAHRFVSRLAAIRFLGYLRPRRQL
jgi:hypothetical protein